MVPQGLWLTTCSLAAPAFTDKVWPFPCKLSGQQAHVLTCCADFAEV